ncbi:TPA: LacI family transcriptional regulator [Kluyvera intermedia]|uniref:LacI family DNA-binding transcriptional regulator n=1 Tax=Citrobacter sp. MNAZ 1397 TaxID=2911205 RepID=UPI001A1C30C5|nr:LacI family transcriptional regulator [Citrobacter sp. MNAZ 1397]HAT2611397.1 LacI family transcriptional regulator [Kluyvera intermedia]
MTIKKLAAILGLSHTTVSRALNDHPAISQATKESVLRAAREYGYIPNSAARALRNASTGAFGLVIPDIQNDFFITVTNAIAHVAAERSWQMMLGITSDKPEMEHTALLRLMTARVDGIIFAPTANPLPETQELITRTNAVQLLRKHRSLQAPVIAIDDRHGISLAVKHLRELGHQRIGYIGSSEELSTGYERLQGFLQCFTPTEQAALQALIHIGPPQAGFGGDAFRRIMAADMPPTALVLGSPRYAMSILLAAKEKNIRIPDDLSLVTYGDVSWSSLLEMKLTYISLPEKQIADACVAIIERLMNQDQTLTPEAFYASTESQIFTPLLVAGDSTKALIARR